MPAIRKLGGRGNTKTSIGLFKNDVYIDLAGTVVSVTVLHSLFAREPFP